MELEEPLALTRFLPLKVRQALRSFHQIRAEVYSCNPAARFLYIWAGTSPLTHTRNKSSPVLLLRAGRGPISGAPATLVQKSLGRTTPRSRDAYTYNMGCPHLNSCTKLLRPLCFVIANMRVGACFYYRAGVPLHCNVCSFAPARLYAILPIAPVRCL